MLIEERKGLVLAKLGNRYKVLSTVPSPDYAEAVAFVQVPKDYCGDFLQDASKVRDDLGLEAVVFFTAAELPDSFVSLSEGDVKVAATVAMTPQTCIGTINVAVVVNRPLSKWGMADLLRTATEAKALAAVDSLLRCNGRRSPGTVTDAVAILAQEGDGEHYAGPATELGQTAARLVYKAVRAGDRYDLFQRIFGLSRREFAGLVKRLFEKAPLPAGEEEILSALEELLKDPNVWALLIAAAELEAHATSGGIPGLAPDEHSADTPRIIIDELLGAALADYIGGFKAVLTTYWVERVKKDGGIPELEMFRDDVLSALLAGVYLRLYERIYGR